MSQGALATVEVCKLVLVAEGFDGLKKASTASHQVRLKIAQEIDPVGESRSVDDQLTCQVHESVQSLGRYSDESAFGRIAPGTLGQRCASDTRARCQRRRRADRIAGFASPTRGSVVPIGEDPRRTGLETSLRRFDVTLPCLLQVLANLDLNIEQERSNASHRRQDLGADQGLDEIFDAMKQLACWAEADGVHHAFERVVVAK